MVACSFWTLVVLYPVFTFNMCLIWLMFWILFLHLSTSLGCFCPRTISHISDLHNKLRILSRSVSGFITGSPCCVWGRRWTTCVLYDDPFSGLYFWNDSWRISLVSWRGILCRFLALFIFLYITSFACYFSPYLFLLWNNFLMVSTLYFHIP